MDIEKETNDFDEFVKDKFPALLQNKQNSNYLAASMCDSMLAAWLEAKLQAAKAQAVPENKQFNLDEFLAMDEKLKSKDGVIAADLDRFIAYAEMVLEKAKAHRSQND